MTAATVPWITFLAGIAYVETGMLATGMAALALLIHVVRENNTGWKPVFTAGYSPESVADSSTRPFP